MRAKREHARASGFTLIETMIAFGLVAMVMVLVLTSFDYSSKTSLVQKDVAELQQSLRASLREVSRMAKPTGRGGLAGLDAVEVSQDITDGTTLGSETVEQDTDVLTLRGVLTTPVFHIDATDDNAFQNNGDTGTLIIDSVTRSGFRQPLDSLHALADDAEGNLAEPLLLVSRSSTQVYAVVELASVSFSNLTVQGREVERATLNLNISQDSGQYTAEYQALSPYTQGGTFPSQLTTVLTTGIVEEYRYFVRQDFVIPGDTSSAPSPKLARIRMVPGTETEHPGDDTTVDIADNIVDFQVALGYDVDGDGEIESFDADGAPLDGAADEWRYNDASDGDDASWGTPPPPLLQLQIALLGETNRPDPGYVSEPIDAIQDRLYGESDTPTGDALTARRHRRRLLEGIVMLRNI